MSNLVKGQFKGRLVPVNPNYTAIMGLPAVPFIGALPALVDLAVIVIPIEGVPGAAMMR